MSGVLWVKVLAVHSKVAQLFYFYLIHDYMYMVFPMLKVWPVLFHMLWETAITTNILFLQMDIPFIDDSDGSEAD